VRNPETVSLRILEEARRLGASLAGIVNASALQRSPSHRSLDQAEWTVQGKSVLILALVHGEDEPELDWWGVEGGTAGNRRLQDILVRLEAHLRAYGNLEGWCRIHPGCFSRMQRRWPE